MHHHSDDTDPDQRHRGHRGLALLDGLSDSSYPARLICRDALDIAAENRRLRDRIRRLEEQVAQSAETIAYTCHRRGYGEGYEHGVADVNAADPHHAVDPDVPAALVYALRAPLSGSGLVNVTLVVHGTEIVATVVPGSDPSRVWASICAAVA